jgi:8-oxo-dGTP diphosphatase
MTLTGNPYENGSRSVIPAVLVYLRMGDQILMLHKNKGDLRQNAHFSKWNGLGGKLEAGESPEEAAIREVFEESGVSLKPSHLCALGTLYFPAFKTPPRSLRPEDWSVWVYSARLTPGTSVQTESPEGTLA